MRPSEQSLIRTENADTGKSATPATVAPPAPMWVDAGRHRTGNIASYLEIPFLHKRLVLGSTLLALVFGWMVILVWPKTYESEARMTMRIGRESVSLDPTATTSATLMLQKTQEEEIISALEVLKSRQLAETVVDEIGAVAILNGVLPGSRGDVGAGSREATSQSTLTVFAEQVTKLLQMGLLHAGIKDEISDRELAVRKVQSSVFHYSPRKSNVVIIEAQAKSPRMAQAIVKQITNAFVDAHLAGAYTDGSHDFFEQQSFEAEVQLNELVKERSKFLREHKIVSIDANRDLLKEQLSGVERDLAVASGQLQQAVSEAEDLEFKVAASDDEVIAAKVAATDSTWSGMRQRVYELELEEQNQNSKYTDKNVKLKQIRKQLEGARDILAHLQSERIDESTTPNPLKTGLREELQRQQTQVVGLRSIIGEKKKQRTELEKQVEKLLGYERQLTQTDREIRLTENRLQALREKLEEARVIEELHAKKISNVHIFQPATFVERAVNPKKRLLAVGFLFLGLMTGFSLSFLRQSSSPSIRTVEDVESKLCCPVVANVPYLSHIQSPRPKEQRLLRKKCQSLIAEVLLSQRGPRQSRGLSLGIIAVDVGSGASTLAANLAFASSVDCRMQTVLVDADVRKRSVSKMFGLNGSPGLVELVDGSASHDECLQKAKDRSVDLVASAADSCDKVLTTSAPEIAAALQAYLQDCDLLIVDLPAASEPDQAIALAQHLDSVLVVIESEKTRTASAERLLRRLSESETEVLGVVLNKTRSYLPKMLRRYVGTTV